MLFYYMENVQQYTFKSEKQEKENKEFNIQKAETWFKRSSSSGFFQK